MKITASLLIGRLVTKADHHFCGCREHAVEFTASHIKGLPNTPLLERNSAKSLRTSLRFKPSSLATFMMMSLAASHSETEKPSPQNLGSNALHARVMGFMFIFVLFVTALQITGTTSFGKPHIKSVASASRAVICCHILGIIDNCASSPSQYCIPVDSGCNKDDMR